MIPAFTTTAEWVLVNVINNSLVLFMVFMWLAAVSLVTAHALIPSLVSTYEVSPRVEGARPILYVFGLLAFVVALFVISLALINGYILIDRIFPRWLI